MREQKVIAVVAAVVATGINLSSARNVAELKTVAEAESWRDADPAIARLGRAGQILAYPYRNGIRLPGWGNWGLPNVRVAASRLLNQPANEA